MEMMSDAPMDNPTLFACKPDLLDFSSGLGPPSCSFVHPAIIFKEHRPLRAFPGGSHLCMEHR
jgi:hypothetical protein